MAFTVIDGIVLFLVIIALILIALSTTIGYFYYKSEENVNNNITVIQRYQPCLNCSYNSDSSFCKKYPQCPQCYSK